MHFVVELSGESPRLAAAELEGACAALAGRAPSPTDSDGSGRFVEVELPDREAARGLVGRLALAYRCIEFRGPAGRAPTWWLEGGAPATGAAFRWLGHERRGEHDPLLRELAESWVRAGGRINLDRPERRFWLRSLPDGSTELGEEIGRVDRSALLSRRLSRLPFRRPVGLDPRLARASVNLARVRRGDRVVDPFVGTGALLAEAALLGARVSGVDVDPAMIRGALANFEHLGLQAEAWIAADAANVPAGAPFDALVTDVPYGRSSGTRGEPVVDLLQRVLPPWMDRVRPGGHVVIVSSGELDPPGHAWVLVRSIAVRQHRSLTRIFSVFERSAPST